MYPHTFDEHRVEAKLGVEQWRVGSGLELDWCVIAAAPSLLTWW